MAGVGAHQRIACQAKQKKENRCGGDEERREHQDTRAGKKPRAIAWVGKPV